LMSHQFNAGKILLIRFLTVSANQKKNFMELKNPEDEIGESF
jgi:hypothetical protein